MDAPTTIGDYTLGPLLGRGGSSEVYAASHPRYGDRLALKLLRDDDDGAFHIEAATREVHHGSVVRIVDAGIDAVTRRCYLVMERLDGPDLAAHLARGPLAEAAARTLFAAIADGMHAVHAHGLVHRDLKPANVMLHAGAPRLVDFGIAKQLGDNAALITSRRIGTLAYMAPEQLVGGRIAPSVDVWALGIMLFEAVTGQLPFGGFTASYTPQLVETAPRVRSLVPVSPGYDVLVARCLDADPARRPSMADIACALRGELAIETVLDERVTQDIGAIPRPAPLSADRTHGDRVASAPESLASRRGAVIALLAAGAIAAIAGIVVLARGDRPAATPSTASSPTTTAPTTKPGTGPGFLPDATKPGTGPGFRADGSGSAQPTTTHDAMPAPPSRTDRPTQRAKKRKTQPPTRRETLD